MSEELAQTEVYSTPPADRAEWSARLIDFLRGAQVAEFLRCTAAGGVAVALDFAALFVLVSAAGIHYLTAAAVGFVIGTLTNYLLNVRWVFSRRRVGNAAVEFQLFVAIMVAGLAINEGLMWALTGWLGAHYLFSKIASAAAVYVWSFSARKLVLF